MKEKVIKGVILHRRPRLRLGHSTGIALYIWRSGCRQVEAFIVPILL